MISDKTIEEVRRVREEGAAQRDREQRVAALRRAFVRVYQEGWKAGARCLRNDDAAAEAAAAAVFAEVMEDERDGVRHALSEMLGGW